MEAKTFFSLALQVCGSFASTTSPLISLVFVVADLFFIDQEPENHYCSELLLRPSRRNMQRNRLLFL